MEALVLQQHPQEFLLHVSGIVVLAAQDYRSFETLLQDLCLGIRVLDVGPVQQLPQLIHKMPEEILSPMLSLFSEPTRMSIVIHCLTLMLVHSNT